MTSPRAFKLPDPPFFTLDEMAVAWSCSVQRLHVLAEHGTEDGAAKLAITEYALKGESVLGISTDERRRFERLAGAQAEGESLSGKERRTLLNLLGAFVVIWDPCEDIQPYAVVRDLEEQAAAHGIPILRGDDTNARMIGEAIALLKAEGYGAKNAA
jgi:hypothetical protein